MITFKLRRGTLDEANKCERGFSEGELTYVTDLKMLAVGNSHGGFDLLAKVIEYDKFDEFPQNPTPEQMPCLFTCKDRSNLVYHFNNGEYIQVNVIASNKIYGIVATTDRSGITF